MTMRYRIRLFALALAAVLPGMPAQSTAAGVAHAETRAARPIRLLVPLGPGSSGDTSARLLARLASEELGQPIVVENRPGADSLVAVQALLSAPADGYCMLVISPSSMILNPLINPASSYAPLRDLRPVAGMMRVSALLVVGGESRFRTLADVLAAAKQAPGSVSMGSYSAYYRLGALRMQQMAGVTFNQVAYKSAAPLQSDLIGGSVDVALMDVGGAMPLISAGKLRALAVAGKERLRMLPAVPTVAEGGVNQYELAGWTGIAVAAKTPEPVAQSIEAALLKAMHRPEFVRFVTENVGADLFAVPGKEIRALVDAETAHYRPFAQSLQATQR
ncbi:Extra-cytoplasmic solute receptor family protein 129 [Cupriavidus taiwanensis]|uniref:Extra-cytoplasmic solute receptor family protein 129 n=1 Tax=Cupriavidus taiwanensis TaxID=164546 RepID=A0A976B0E8_9BURK|nr:tripartite tricarboxylate transporter substrate binding protein [Cupriavidus taiwanensis]SOZ64406.1 Extra-cytoplasmic solute receptor family protein 129 [Cupriavidus taiwanensis]SOZ65114.1 Extra-cytoplasmic solute receptor family protein 129 [Cupriavidus taiwanensis]SOZ68792.1 Extra-cytoplasmic solute receptor family protein 129 [Cupriavidus taiwanensis]SPA08217.1 Extra-cytoplasmic solute receptor family protein 129 [Cupriavidus taiwanensis]